MWFPSNSCCRLALETPPVAASCDFSGRASAAPSATVTLTKRTVESLAKSERGEDVHHAKDADGLFGQLGI
jgi:hypothetical protein